MPNFGAVEHVPTRTRGAKRNIACHAPTIDPSTDAWYCITISFAQGHLLLQLALCATDFACRSFTPFAPFMQMNR